MTEPAKIADAPTVRLGGKDWPIPPLVPRQLRHMRASLLELNKLLSAGDATYAKLTDEQYDSLLLKPVWRALTRAHPDLTEDEFLDMELSEGQLVNAWYVVRDQSGIFVKNSKKEGGGADASKGEARTPANGTGIG